MNRELNFFPLFTAIITIAASLTICFFNMYILVKHKRSCFTVCLHIASLFAVCGLVFNMMSKAVFVLPLAVVYGLLSKISFLLVGVSFAAGAAAVIVCGQKQNYRNLSPNIEGALASIDDVVFVVDSDGAVTHINHPEKYRSLFGEIKKIDGLTEFIKSNCSAEGKCCEIIDCIEDTMACELVFKNTGEHFIFKISPIEAGGSRFGYTAVLENVTAIKESERALREQNDYLKEANRKLTNYVRVAGELEAEKERLQILEHVQLTLINEIEKALSSVRKIKQHSFEDDTYKLDMKNLAIQLRRVYSEVRNAVGKIAGKEV